MKKTEPLNFKFDGVYLTKLHFDMPQERPKDFKYNFDFNVTRNIDPSKTKLAVILHVKLYKKFSFDMLGFFSISEKDNKDVSWERFAEYNAPALLMPFAREIVHSLTSKSLLPTLLLPPINMRALLQAKSKARGRQKRKPKKNKK